MADRTIEVITPASGVDLVTLDEAKLLMGMSTTDTSDDTQLQLWIDINSATIATMCNRTLGREEVNESWRELAPGHRIFLSRRPVSIDDIQSVEANGALLDPTEYELEEASGKLSIFTQTYWPEPVIVHYTGGYNLPDEAPLPLKRACGLLNVQSKLLASIGTVGGVRLLGHKEARIAFHDPMKILEAAMGGAGSPVSMAIMALLSHYIYYEV